MANLIQIYGRIDLQPYGVGGAPIELHSQLMAPNHGRVPIVGRIEGRGESLEAQLCLVIDGEQMPAFFHRIWTANDLADAWEVAHHQHHGYDPRGLDPREGPTRLRLR